MDMQLERKKALIDSCRQRLTLQDPAVQLIQKKQQLDQMKQRLFYSMQDRIKDCRHRTALCAGKLDALSPLKKLSGGFAYVTDEEENPVLSASSLNPEQRISLQFSDGKVQAEVIRIK